MIAILVLIVSLNAIQCQNFCLLMKTDGKYEGIQVFHSTVHNSYVMYKNGIQWEFGLENRLEMKNNSQKPINETIVNRFSGSGYDCNVTQKSNEHQIVTNCTVGRVDTVSQYDPKAIIFRPSGKLTNDLVIIYSKSGPKIWCYSPKEQSLKNRLVNDTNECKQKMGMKATDKLFLESMDQSIVQSIDGLVDREKSNLITGYHIFFRHNNRPYYCPQSLADKEILCNSIKNWKPILEECFGEKGGPKGKNGDSNLLYWLLGVVVCVIVVISLILLAIKYLWKGGEKETDPTPATGGRPQPSMNTSETQTSPLPERQPPVTPAVPTTPAPPNPAPRVSKSGHDPFPAPWESPEPQPRQQHSVPGRAAPGRAKSLAQLQSQRPVAPKGGKGGGVPP